MICSPQNAVARSYETTEGPPESVTVTRPHLGRAVVVSVRLSAEEHGRLQQAVQNASAPISTLIRLWALDRLCAEREGAHRG
jgi:hypothetical protein